MTPGGGVERRDAHQPVYAYFRLHQAVHVVAVDLEGHRLDARALALQPVRDHGAEALALGPAQVHAQQHLGPILALGAPGAGMDLHDPALEKIVPAGEQQLGLELVERSASVFISWRISPPTCSPSRCQLEQGVEVGHHQADARVVG